MNVRSISEIELICPLPPNFLLRLGAESTSRSGVSPRVYLVARDN